MISLWTLLSHLSLQKKERKGGGGGGGGIKTSKTWNQHSFSRLNFPSHHYKNETNLKDKYVSECSSVHLKCLTSPFI